MSVELNPVAGYSGGNPFIGMGDSAYNPASGGATHVVETIFSGPYDIDPITKEPNVSAYTGNIIDPNEPGAALPFRFSNSKKNLPNVWVKITSQTTGKYAVVPIVDVGPHGKNNPYWMIPNGDSTSGDKRNRSGLDMTPATGRILGLPVSTGKLLQQDGSKAIAPAFKTPRDEYFDFEFIQ